MSTILFMGSTHWKDNKAQVLGFGMERRIFLTGDTGAQGFGFKSVYAFALYGRNLQLNSRF